MNLLLRKGAPNLRNLVVKNAFFMNLMAIQKDYCSDVISRASGDEEICSCFT